MQIRPVFKIIQKSTLFRLGVLCSASLFSLSAAGQWDEDTWEKILLRHHDGPTILAKNFYFTQNPHSNTKQEIDSFANRLFEDPSISCLFPARTYLLRRLRNLKIDFPPCPEFENFRQKVAGKNIFLVFSGHHLKSPSSTFGHTLLKFSSDQEDDLLSYAVNFAAVPTVNNPFIYAFKGLTGGFDGRFQSMPYFYKLREYSDSEARDLWSYQLNLDSDEKEFLISLIYELSPFPIPYYYATQNCSSVIQKTINAIIKNKSIHDRYISTPLMSVSNFFSTRDLVSKVSFRASLRKKFLFDFERSTKKVKDQFFLIKSQRLTDRNFPQEESQAIDLWLAYNNVNNFKKINTPQESNAHFRKKLLKRRSLLPPQKKSILNSSEEMADPPHLAHPQHRIRLFQNLSHSRQEINFRLVGHDDSDPQKGIGNQLNFSLIEISLQHSSLSPAKIKDFFLLRSQATPHFFTPFSEISWGFDFGMARTDYINNPSLSPFLSADFGISWRKRNFKLVALLSPEIIVHQQFEKERFIFMAPSIKFLWNINDQLGFEIENIYRWPLLRRRQALNTHYNISILQFFKRYSLGINYKNKNQETNWHLSTTIYI